MRDEIIKTLEDVEKYKTGAFAFKSSPTPIISYSGMLLKVMRVHINGKKHNGQHFKFSWVADKNNAFEENLNLIVGKKSNNDTNPLKFFIFNNDEEILSYKTADFINISIEAFDNNCKIGKNDDINSKIFLISVTSLNLNGEYISSFITSNDEELKKYVKIVEKINSGRNFL